jgi:hypothetical protein
MCDADASEDSCSDITKQSPAVNTCSPMKANWISYKKNSTQR